MPDGLRYKAARSFCSGGCCGYFFAYDTRSKKITDVGRYERDIAVAELNEGVRKYHTFHWYSVDPEDHFDFEVFDA